MRARFFGWLAIASGVGALSILAGCPASVPDVGPYPDGGGDGANNDGAPTCDPSKDPSCVSDSTGLFVNGASGSDSNAGTKESPLKTIGAAVSKASSSKPNLYICAGTYDEPVALTSALNLYGGLSCGDWSYTGTPSVVAPSSKGFALKITSLSSAITISDMEFDAQDATDPGESSIAVFAYQASAMTLKRVKVKAGKGASAGAADDPPTNLFDADAGALTGNAASGTTGGPAKVCACKSSGTTTGGAGGAAGNPAVDGGPGTSDPVAVVQGGRTGAGGAGFNSTSGACAPGLSGSDGSASDGGAASVSNGAITSTGWTPSAGTAGGAGDPGCGGGGGGGGVAGGSGGGGCGGCGGAGGLGGPGGGSSIAILVNQTALTVMACTLITSDAGKGGKGSTGEGGAGGGAGNVGACGGGLGGNGAGGGGGAGGAGGVSVGVVYSGSAPSIDGATTTTPGQAGAGGDFGLGGLGGTNALSTASTGPNGAHGLDGVAQAVLEIK